jgi:hypothetical protein
MPAAIPPVSDCARKVRLTAKKVRFGIKTGAFYGQTLLANSKYPFFSTINTIQKS